MADLQQAYVYYYYDSYYGYYYYEDNNDNDDRETMEQGQFTFIYLFQKNQFHKLPQKTKH